MFINEFPADTKLDISIKIGEQKIKLSTVISKPVEEETQNFGFCVFCEPIIINNRMISFENYPAVVTIFNKEDKRVYNFKASCIVTNKKRKIMLICSKENARPSDNRTAFRIPCSYDINFKLGTNTKVFDGRTHDVSYSGAAFIVDNDIEVNVGDKITASVFDLEEYVYKVTGRVVRICEGFDKDTKLLGIKFTSNGLQGLVSRLQIKETRLKKLHTH